MPPVPGLAQTAYLTSETIWDLEDLLARLTVLGGGSVGCELAQAFARLGSQVTIIEAAPRLLPAADPAASRLTTEVLRAEGIGVHTGAAAASARQQHQAVTVTLASGTELTASRLLVAPPSAGHRAAACGERRGPAG